MPVCYPCDAANLVPALCYSSADRLPAFADAQPGDCIPSRYPIFTDGRTVGFVDHSVVAQDFIAPWQLSQLTFLQALIMNAYGVMAACAFANVVPGKIPIPGIVYVKEKRVVLHADIEHWMQILFAEWAFEHRILFSVRVGALPLANIQEVAVGLLLKYNGCSDHVFSLW